ncbi:nicotinate-nucleotide pyrophosphorylase [carboxylating]-like [Anneissia japonica]|uniref:nicotinate-nucleotide pyrophosphorylase [carboxylating]-like n=1 Tax=Anneissia japonica TaxID=1529436 RepID=UPI00142560D2|nr:nicotinate-nucleotide pyrophosphorylase [carboxylating]-like [Anneissia japonica]XP_033119319.1 nicotinate-nucleotide pyrophosphorylase [carboxylating]-like [Anneissia japonica]XP_033119320.1 nicotinate-nucleotide pyrophosphorylase [carboxylating]-like [Anneissia japonica]
MSESIVLKNTVQDFSSLLHPVAIQELVERWLQEDTPSFDYGGFVVGSKQESAVLLCKSRGVLCGVPFFSAIFTKLGCTVEWYFSEGELLQPVCTVATVTGPVKNILLGERIGLNCITRASGIASIAREMSDMAKEAGWHGKVAGTRKTTPGFRMVEKYALLVGGVSTHRYDLSSMIMLKDNHIWSAGSIAKAVDAARSVGGFSIKIEVECRSIEEATEAATAAADVVMLDNFHPKTLHPAAKVVKERFPNVTVEVSGGITKDTLQSYFGEYVDVVSLGKLTQGYPTVDFSLKICKEGHDPTNPLVTNIGK